MKLYYTHKLQQQYLALFDSDEQAILFNRWATGVFELTPFNNPDYQKQLIDLASTPNVRTRFRESVPLGPTLPVGRSVIH